MADHDDELAEAVRELTRTIDDLRQELESTQRRSPFRPPTPRPPTPRELLRFTDEIAIPATVAVLETSVRALEGFQRALRVARTEREVRDRASETTSATAERATDLRRSTLSRLDSVLEQLQQAASDGTLPTDDRARDLLEDARDLRDDVDRRLESVGDDLESSSSRSSPSEPSVSRPSETDSTDAIRIDIEENGIDKPQDDETDDTVDESSPRVDVDAELETLKDQYGADEGDSTDETADAEHHGENDEHDDSSGASEPNDTDTADAAGDNSADHDSTVDNSANGDSADDSVPDDPATRTDSDNGDDRENGADSDSAGDDTER